MAKWLQGGIIWVHSWLSRCKLVAGGFNLGKVVISWPKVGSIMVKSLQDGLRGDQSWLSRCKVG
jgi:hypothetical protein